MQRRPDTSHTGPRGRRSCTSCQSPRARLEDGHPCGEWTLDVEAAGLAHRVSTFSWAKTPAHRRRARTPKRVPSVACQSRSSGRGGGASRNPRGCWPPKASRCSGSLSSLSKRNSEAHSRAAHRPGWSNPCSPPPRRRATSCRRWAAARAARGPWVGEHGEVLERGRAPALRIVTERPDPGDRRLRLATSDGDRLERTLGVRRGERDEAHPHAAMRCCGPRVA